MSDHTSMMTVDRYLSALESGLRGHGRDKSRLLLELRDGLEDAAAAHVAHGLSPQQAREQALDGFGSVEELVQSCQPELVVRQMRRTARAVATTVPALIAFWRLLFGARADQLPRGAVLLGEHLAGLGAATAVLAVVTLLLTGPLSQWLPMPRRLPRLVAVAGVVSAVSMAVAPIGMAAASWPLVIVAGGAAAALLRTVARSAWLCHSCAAHTS